MSQIETIAVNRSIASRHQHLDGNVIAPACVSPCCRPSRRRRGARVRFSGRGRLTPRRHAQIL